MAQRRLPGVAPSGRLVVDAGPAAGANIGTPGNGQGVVPWARYLHGDLIGSTMLTTDESGVAVSAVSYTAFGEPIADPGLLRTRYQYAGAWGYESGPWGNRQDGPPADGPLALYGANPKRDIVALYGPDPGLPAITLMHVGYCWYDPATGRFIQRDPIGLLGALNVYLYCDAEPLTTMDPRGTEGGLGPHLWPATEQPPRPPRRPRPPRPGLAGKIDEIVFGKPFGAATTGGTSAAGAANFKWRLGIGRLVNRLVVISGGFYIGWLGGYCITEYTGLDDLIAEGLSWVERRLLYDLWD